MINLEIERTEDIKLCRRLEGLIFSDPYKITMFINDTAKELYIFRLDEIAIGYAYLHSYGREKEIYRIGLLPNYRGKGLGTDYFKKLLEMNDGDRFLLEVGSNNTPAIKLYFKCGFKEYHRRKRYYKDGQDAILMSFYKEGTDNER